MHSLTPKITITQTDFARLNGLAEATARSNSVVSEYLLSELDRATIKPDRLVKSNTIKMGSALTYETDRGERRTVTLVYPCDADILAGKISVLTPIGAALIGLRAGQTIDWTRPNGAKHRLTIVAVDDGAGALARAAK